MRCRAQEIYDNIFHKGNLIELASGDSIMRQTTCPQNPMKQQLQEAKTTQ